MGDLAGEARCQPEPCTERYWSNYYMSRARHLHHDGRVTESGYSLGLWTGSLGPWWPGPRRVLAPSRSGRWEERWPGRGGFGGGRGGAGCVCAAFRAVLRRGGRCPCGTGRRRGFVQFLDEVIVLPVAVHDWGHGPDSAARGVPQLQYLANVLTCPYRCMRVQFLDRFLTCPLLCNARCLYGCQVVDISVVAQTQIPMVRFTTEILQMQYIDKVIDVCCAGLRCALSVETVEIPQLQARFFLDHVVDMPVVFNDRCWCRSAQNCDGPAVAAHLPRWSMSLLAQFIDGSHVPVIMQRQIQ